MIEMVSRSTRKRLLEIPSVLATLAVSVVGLIQIEDPVQRLPVFLLLLAFAVLNFTPYLWRHGTLLVQINLGLLTGVTAALMLFFPGWNYFPILFFILAPTAMIYLPLKRGFAWIGVFCLVSAAIFVGINGLIGLLILLPFAAGFIFFGTFGWTMIDAERNRDRNAQLLAELQAAHRQLQDYTARAEELAIAQERNRIAREMHDTLGHRLTIAAVQLEGAQRLIPSNPERAISIIGVVREQVKGGLSDLRRTVAMLRASVEEDLPLDTALARLVEQVGQGTSLKIHLSIENCPPNLTLPQHQALYRAAQEGLTNIQRHSGASEAWLRLSAHDGAVELLVSDNGVGIEPDEQPSGFGILGLKERAALQGGDFHVDARPGGGTQLTFRIPQAQPDEAQTEPVCDPENRRGATPRPRRLGARAACAPNTQDGKPHE
jgi:signal transduction histidine kinase